MIGNVKPGVDPERSDYRMLRAERGTCSRSTPGFDHIHTEYTSSFLNLRPIQDKIKTFKTLFEKCKPIYDLKIKKSEFKTGGTLQFTETRRRLTAINENPS